MRLLKKQLYVFDRLIERHFAQVFAHFKVLGITPILYAAEWFSTLFG